MEEGIMINREDTYTLIEVLKATIAAWEEVKWVGMTTPGRIKLTKLLKRFENSVYNLDL